MSVSYMPLKRQLLEKKLNKRILFDNGISAPTLSKLSKDEYVAMSVIDRICQILNCKVEDVVEIILDETDDGAHE